MRFFGKVWFEETTETSPGVWTPNLIPREYFGDLNRYQRKWSENQDSTNDSFSIANEISIVSDSYMMENLGFMRCVEYQGVKWKISSIIVQYPRVVLTIGDVYNVEKEVDDEQD